MKSLGAAACLLLLLACAACAASPDGGGGSATSLPVVTFTPGPHQPIPDTLTESSPFQLGASVRSGFACFTMDGVPVVWPAGYSAVRQADGKLEVREKAGRLLRTGGTQLLDQMNVTSAGDACSGKGQNVTVVLSLPASA
jgi:hypothetical protein